MGEGSSFRRIAVYSSSYQLVNQQQTMARHLVTRIRHTLEATTVDAANEQEAIEKSRKLKRSEWNHIDSKRRRAYKAEKVDVDATSRTR